MRRQIFSLIMAAASLSAMAVELPEIISDNAVLQQKSDVKLWGWSKPGRTVTVTPSWSEGKSYIAKADKKTGCWAWPCAGWRGVVLLGAVEHGDAPARLLVSARRRGRPGHSLFRKISRGKNGDCAQTRVIYSAG